MGYKLLKNLIRLRRKTKDELTDMAAIYYKAGKLTDKEYSEVTKNIEEI